MGRANLAKWVAAASVIQRCVRSWLFRRRMRQWLAGRHEAAVVLQACWRGRQARGQLEHMASSCIVIQVSVLIVAVLSQAVLLLLLLPPTAVPSVAANYQPLECLLCWRP
jgi:hypothetical protein